MQAAIHPINVHDAPLNNPNSVNNLTEMYRSVQFLPAMQDAFLNIRKKVFAEFCLRKLSTCISEGLGGRGVALFIVYSAVFQGEKKSTEEIANATH